MASGFSSHPTDQSLARDAARGDLHAFDLLVRRYRNLLLTRLLRLGLQPEEAEDVAQEAFLAAFLRLWQLRDPERFLPWLLSIAHNLAVARVRSQHPTEPLPEDSLLETGGLPETAARLGVEAALIVSRALEGLPHSRRRALHMFVAEGKDHRQIAAALSRPPGTIRRWLSEARRLLAEEEQTMSETAPGPARGLLLSNIMSETDVTRVFAALQEAGLQPAQFKDYDAFASALGEEPPAIIVLDEVIGDCGAFELMALLKGRPETRHLPVVMLGPARERTVHAAWHAGVDCYLSKPFQQQELATFIRRILEATTDALTAVLNRRGLDDALGRARADAQRAGYGLTLALVDVDRFEEFNARFGRAEGDQAVQAVAQVLLTALGDCGAVARSGAVARHAGDEFVVIMPGADAEHASGVLESAQRMLDERTDLPAPVHLACGVVTWPATEIPEAREMLRQAEEEMLRDKLRPGGRRAGD